MYVLIGPLRHTLTSDWLNPLRSSPLLTSQVDVQNLLCKACPWTKIPHTILLLWVVLMSTEFIGYPYPQTDIPTNMFLFLIESFDNYYYHIFTPLFRGYHSWDNFIVIHSRYSYILCLSANCDVKK
jgi:hypothetical protein